MSLKEYVRKRNFKQTTEPKGRLAPHAKKKLEFVVHKHDASHLHYDFRLEMEGVLKSWAVPKGPSMDPSQRRLAVQVEDHPFDYRTFEGSIPKGNYGAGDVIVWDKGTYEPLASGADNEKKLLAGLASGDVTFVIHGHKLKGEFKLIRSADNEKNWLLIKKRDKYATTDDVTAQDQSVVSHKSLPKADTDFIAGPKAKMPKKVKPMLARLVDSSFSDPDWLYEIKWDGYRAIGGWDGKSAELYSRTGQDFSVKYPSIFEAFHHLKNKVVLDGEIVALDSDGRANFNWLQNFGKDSRGSLVYYAFDILWLDGHDLTGLPLLKRKELLSKILIDSTTIRYSDHVTEDGEKFFEAARQKGLEGIMAKSSLSRYVTGSRPDSWLKIKTKLRQEVVIGGFTEPRGHRKYIGALLVGVYESGELRYVGHVGGGIPPRQLEPLRAKLLKLEQKEPPFKQKVKPNNEVHWIKPQLLAEVSFAEWTPDGLMRQPIFVGLREDKPASEVHEEKAVPVSKVLESSDYPFKLTHLDKVFWPETGYTKGDLLKYYESVMEYMLPYIIDRPHNLLRHPNGYKGSSFFQKDVTETAPDWAKTEAYYSDSNKKTMRYLVCEGPRTLAYMVQLGCIEINPWSSHVGQLEKPDWCVIDLDPEGISFNEVVKVARTVKEICSQLNIDCLPKTSGKTGLHIFIPTAAKYSFEQVRIFAEVLANLTHERHKATTSLERNPAKRPNRIYVDYLQNRETQTLAAPYSVRPTKFATVSTPLTWDEVKQGLDPAEFTIKNTAARVKSIGDLWQPVLGAGIDLSKVMDSLSS